MRQSELIEVFEKAIKKNNSLNFPNMRVAVVVEMPGATSPEFIVNPPENLEYKLDYYTEKYNEDLELKGFPAIKIVDCISFDYLHDFNYLMEQYIDLIVPF